MTDEELARGHGREYPSIIRTLDAKDQQIENLQEYAAKLEGQLVELRERLTKL